MNTTAACEGCDQPFDLAQCRGFLVNPATGKRTPVCPTCSDRFDALAAREPHRTLARVQMRRHTAALRLLDRVWRRRA